jgi:hypothetical protein
MKRQGRKTNPKVVDGKVQKKNRTEPTPSYWNTSQDIPAIDRERPGSGYKHLLKKRDIVDFISILPDWEELSKGLDAVLLATGEYNTDGWYSNLGIVAICAWEKELWRKSGRDFIDDHEGVLNQLGVEREARKDHVLCKFTEPQARAYQLLHVFLHELGHHHDRMTTKSKRGSARGEDYAETYALKYADVIWQRYQECFEV